MIVTRIDGLLSEEASVYRDLTHAELRRAGGGEGLFIAESVNVIAAAVEKGCLPISFLSEEGHIPALEEAFGKAFPDVPLYTAPPEEIAKLAGYRLHRGVLAAFRRNVPLSPTEAVKGGSRIAVLENVTDPTNVGAIFRSAAALGMDAVLLASSCCDPMSRRALRVSMGAVFRVPWAVVPCLDENKNALDVSFIRSLGFYPAALALSEDALCLSDPRLKEREKLALILGAEGPGLSPATVSACGCAVRIPMRHGMDSLNVAAAAAVAFWEFGKKDGRL